MRNDHCYIIAEIGGNFTDLETARRQVEAAAVSGVDAVKLQTFRADTLASRAAVFDMENTGIVPQHDLFLKYEIDEALHREVFALIAAKGMDWFSTPSHESDVDMLEKMGAAIHKIGSDDAVNIPFLRYVARTGKPMILSTGMCTLDEVRVSVAAVLAAGTKDLTILHAITSYPTHPEHVNLRAMVTLMREFPTLKVGYSDHTKGTTACLAAAALGARALEKHFTHDKNAPGPDHMLSADGPEMAAIVRGVRDIELMLGDGIKRPAESEKTTRLNNRKSVVLARAVARGQALTATDLAVKRPGWGIAPKELDGLVGRVAAADLPADSVLEWKHLRP